MDVLRPTFRVAVSLERDEAERLLAGLVRRPGLKGESVGSHLLVTVSRESRHFWSPWLHLEVLSRSGEASGDGAGTCEVFGRFSPNPALWTGFMLTYLALAVLIGMALIFGVSQQMLDQKPTAYWIVPGAGVMALAMLIASRIGQRLAHEQMVLLHAQTLESLGVSGDASVA